MMQQERLTEEDIQGLYAWIDEIPLSRPKRNISRDFADGVLCAEVVKHFIPKMVDIHNYSAASSVSQKLYNWNTLNQKVFKRLNYSVSAEIMDCIVNNKPGYIEYLLFELRAKIERYGQTRKDGSTPTIEKKRTGHLPMTSPKPQKPLFHPPSHGVKSHSNAGQSLQAGFGSDSGPGPERGNGSLNQHTIIYAPGGLMPQQQSNESSMPYASQTGHPSSLGLQHSPSTSHYSQSLQQQTNHMFSQPSPVVSTGYQQGNYLHPHPPPLPKKQPQALYQIPSQSMGSFQSQPSHQQEKDQMIHEMQDTINILQLKISKLEQLMKLKDKRIEDLTQRLRSNGLV